MTLRLAVAAIAAACVLTIAGAPSFAARLQDREANPPPPPTIEELENIPKINKLPKEFEKGENNLPIEMRTDALREAALSYGARGGLAWRTWEIRQELETRAAYLDKVFDFRNLLIPAPSGLLIEPPVISESMNALIIDGGGMNAAVADRVYDMVSNARITSAARVWRNYLERDWGNVAEPPDILRPNSAEERAEWIERIREGWALGIDQANEIFQDDLNELSTDYQGMVRYRTLLAQGMVTPPYAMQVDRGVTTDNRSLRVGDRAVQIANPPAFVAGSETWQPANR